MNAIRNTQLRSEAPVAGGSTRELSVPVEGLERPYTFHVEGGHVNFKGRRLSLVYALKKSLVKAYHIVNRSHLIGEISSHVNSEPLEVWVVELTPLVTNIVPRTPQQIRGYQKLLRSSSDRSSRDSDTNWKALAPRERIKQEREVMLAKIASQPITPEQQEVFEQAFESLQHEPN